MRYLVTVLVAVVPVLNVTANGLLIPEDKTLPPLAMVHHRVTIAIEDQVAQTNVEQVFRNHTNRPLEATYIFPVPKGASVNKFSMWVNDKEYTGELLDAPKAAQIYTDIVRRTQDPGLLEYIGNNLFRLRVFPILPKSDQKVRISFTAVNPQEAGIVEYLYPLKTDGKATATLEDFSIKSTLKSQHAIQNIYSPTHAISVLRKSDHEVTMSFERNQVKLDKDFQLFYTLSNKEVGITPLLHKPISSEDGYFLILLSPQMESFKSKITPRDVVLVMDTSGSMDAVKMDQARKALQYCLKNLNAEDRFAVLSFATGVRTYRDELVKADSDHREAAIKWVDNLRAGGGTAIQPALDAALGFRPTETSNSERPFTIIFFTDGQPTIGEMKPENIVKKVKAHAVSNVRIFTFGVGDDVNAVMLDRIAETTNAISSYVRPAEDIQLKATSLYDKVSQPVLANIKLSVTGNIKLEEMYPQQLPDLFFGTQLILCGRYNGTGPAAVKISGTVAGEVREFAYDINFPVKTEGDREFVENIWARRKVGFLLDQIRSNGEQKEILDELLKLAKKYGIATPYTSYLVVPDEALPVVPPVGRPRPVNALPPGDGGMGKIGVGESGALPQALIPTAPGVYKNAPLTVREFALGNQSAPNGSAEKREKMEKERLAAELDQAKKDGKSGEVYRRAWEAAQGRMQAYDEARDRLNRRQLSDVQNGKLGVDISLICHALKNQERAAPTAVRNVGGRNCLEIGGVWIDEGYKPQQKSLIVKAQSDAYFQLLAKRAELKDLFRLGNHLVWVTPSNTALIVDTTEGTEKLTEGEIDALFLVMK